jgi:hypothetical protein
MVGCEKPDNTLVDCSRNFALGFVVTRPSLGKASAWYFNSINKHGGRRRWPRFAGQISGAKISGEKTRPTHIIARPSG